jgi:hypothetical protein
MLTGCRNKYNEGVHFDAQVGEEEIEPFCGNRNSSSKCCCIVSISCSQFMLIQARLYLLSLMEIKHLFSKVGKEHLNATYINFKFQRVKCHNKNGSEASLILHS